MMNKYKTKRKKILLNSKKQIAKNYKIGIFQMIFGSVKKKFSTIIIIKWNIAHISNKFIARPYLLQFGIGNLTKEMIS